jgi:hypothetical protein
MIGDHRWVLGGHVHHALAGCGSCNRVDVKADDPFRVLELEERVGDVAGIQKILAGGTQHIRRVTRCMSGRRDRLHALDNLLAVLD